MDRVVALVNLEAGGAQLRSAYKEFKAFEDGEYDGIISAVRAAV